MYIEIGCVGEALGSELKHALDGYGMNVTYVKQRTGIGSGIAVVDGDEACLTTAQILNLQTRILKGRFQLRKMVTF